jgi:hypothetical protein
VIFSPCSNSLAQQLVCGQCAHYVLFYPHLESAGGLARWIRHHLQLKPLIAADTFVDIVTRLAALYTLIETPQQSVGTTSNSMSKDERTNRHVVAAAEALANNPR